MDTAGRITGVRVNSHSETPGLGARYAADGALSGYNGLGSGVADDTVRLTGASVTGRAISECVNAAFDAFAEITEGR